MSYLQRAARLVLLAYACLFSACGSPPTSLPLPTPQTLRVSYPLSLRPAGKALHACAEAQPQIALLVSEVPSKRLDASQFDLSLWLGAPPDESLFAAPLAQEAIVLVVNPENPISRLNSTEIVEIFSGETLDWQSNGDEEIPVQVWVYPRGNELRSLFEAVFLPKARLTTLARLAPEPAAMLEAVSNDRGAIGYLPHASLDDQVKPVQLDEMLAENLIQPVLALSSREPEGAARAFLVCLQSGAGQEELMKIYEAAP